MANLVRIFRDFVNPAIVLILTGVIVFEHFYAIPATINSNLLVNGRILGHQFKGPVASSFGDAWAEAATILEQGRTVGDAQAALQKHWQTERAKAFATLVAPEFSKVLPEGTEPATSAQRAEVVRLWRDFAVGLKGGR